MKTDTPFVLNIEMINTGTELMLGRLQNGHQQWLCQELSTRGYRVSRQTAVADQALSIEAAVREALGRATVIVVTGGLGPTSDDLTRDAVASLLGVALLPDPAVIAHLEVWFQARRRVRPLSTQVQAMVPEGAIVLPNTHGTAPGLLMEVRPNPFASNGNAAWLVLLPGPPRELRPMFLDQVLPWLTKTFPVSEPFRCRTLRTTGIGESAVQEAVGGPLAALVQEGLEIAYCARPGEVDLRLAARGADADRIVAAAESLVRGPLRQYAFGVEEETLEQVVVRQLTERHQTLVVAESCTGGRLASRITDVPGASAVFLGGVVTYSNPLKQQLLGVAPQTLEQSGAVSEATAREMAEGARTRFGADYALAITGIAGPTGGTPDKPVGTVFLALATGAGTKVVPHVNTYDRETFKHVTSQQALDLLRQEWVG